MIKNKFFLLILLSLTTLNNFPVVDGLSCLKKTHQEGSHNKRAHKIVLLHDKHGLPGEEDQLVRQQRVEMGDLISMLSKKPYPVSFYVEHPSLTKNFNGIYSGTITHSAIDDALKHNWKNGSIEYASFDKRSEDYFWVREMLLNKAAVIHCLQTNPNQLPAEFFNTTSKTYFENLLKDKENAEKIISNWNPAAKNSAQKKIKSLEDVQKTNDGKSQHMIYSIMELNNSFDLFEKHTQAHSVYSDISLCDQIMNDKNRISVVHAGAYHTLELEKVLKTVGYCDAFNGKDLKNGLDIQGLNSITWSTNPSMNINIIKEFLSEGLAQIIY